MATTIYGNTVTKTVSGSTKSWRAKTTYTVTDYPTYVTIAVTTYFSLLSDSAYFVTNRITSYWYANDWLVKSASGPSSNSTLHQGDYVPATYTITRQKAATASTVNIYGKVVVGSSSDWSGTSTTAVQAITIPALTAFNVTYNNNGGSGSISAQTKYEDLAITLSDGTGFTKSNSTLTGWNTASDGSGTAYILGGQFTDNADTILYAQWHLDYIQATVSNLAVYRVASAGSTTEADEGERIHIGFDYVGGSLDGGSTKVKPSVKIKIDGTQVYNAAQSSATGSFSADYGTYSKDTAHNVEVTVYDTNDPTGQVFTAEVSTATYPIDLVGSGTDVYMGVMTPAVTGQTLTLGDTNVDGDVDINGSYKINGVNLSASDVGALAAALVSDYVTEKGTDGLWTYRKWSSGKVEAWSVYTFASATPSTWVSPVRYMDKTVNIPSGIFSATPNMTASARSNQYWVVDCVASSETSASMRIATLSSSAMASSANIYAWTD